MEPASALIRRYIDLLESRTIAVKVTVERYAGIDQIPVDGSPFPATFTLQADPAYDGDAISDAIKNEIRSGTGYEPASFKWAWAPASPEEKRTIIAARAPSRES